MRAPRDDRYLICIEPGALDAWPDRLAAAIGSSRVWVVTDEQVWKAVGPRFSAADGASDSVAGVYRLKSGERSKSLAAWQALISWFAEKRVGRRDVVVALGGSMVSDVAGFAAACYMRGIRYVNIPTSLVSQVDGSVGGKVAVNLADAKNLIGSFHHPSFVLTDPSALSSLPDQEISCGLAEIIKSFVITPDGLFGELERRIGQLRRRDISALTWVVHVAVRQKMELVDMDPYEADLDRSLNFGHTIAHALEAGRSYESIRHGEAVAIGMASATRLGLTRHITEPETARRILGAIRAAALPDRIEPALARKVVSNTEMIARVRGGSLRFVVPRALGVVTFLGQVDPGELSCAAVGRVGRRGGPRARPPDERGLAGRA